MSRSESIISKRLEAVELRGPSDMQRALKGKRPGNSITLQLGSDYVRLTLCSIVPMEKRCSGPRCTKTFKPARAYDEHCSPKCARESKYANAQERIRTGRLKLTDKDRLVLSLLSEMGPSSARQVGLRAGQRIELASAWCCQSMKKLMAVGMVSRSGPLKGGRYSVVSCQD